MDESTGYLLAKLTSFKGDPLTATSELSDACVPTCTPTETGSTTPSPEPEVVASSRAWIAGAVLGPVIALALGIALFWFYVRRRAHQRQKPELAEVEGQNQIEAKGTPRSPEVELDTKHNITELPSPPPASELESQTIAELESPFVPRSLPLDGRTSG